MKRDIKSDFAVNDVLTLFDEQFSIDNFRVSIEKAEENANNIVESSQSAVRKALEKEENSSKFVVDMDDNIRAAIDAGEMKLETSKDGKIYAQLRRSNGQYGQKLAIKEEMNDNGISAAELELALQMVAMKTQLENIIHTLQEVDNKLADIYQGQRNDRVGLFYSGMSLYLEAREISNPALKELMTVQALKSITDADAQLIQEVRTSVDHLVKRKYNREKRITDDINKHLNIIQQCYSLIFKATMIKAMIYQEQGELSAMVTVLDEYSRFIDKMIMPYSNLLTELDKDEMLLNSSKWKMISNTKTDCNIIKNILASNNEYCLTTGGVEIYEVES